MLRQIEARNFLSLNRTNNEAEFLFKSAFEILRNLILEIY